MTCQELMQAVKLLAKSRVQVYDEEGDSPAWKMLVHACEYLAKQATAELRGEVTP